VDGTRGGAPDAPELLVVRSHRVRLEERVLLLELLLVDARDVFLLPLLQAPRVVLPRGRRGHERDVAVERVALQTRERVVLRRVVQRLGGALTELHETPQLDERASCGREGREGRKGGWAARQTRSPRGARRRVGSLASRPARGHSPPGPWSATSQSASPARAIAPGGRPARPRAERAREGV